MDMAELYFIHCGCWERMAMLLFSFIAWQSYISTESVIHWICMYTSGQTTTIDMGFSANYSSNQGLFVVSELLSFCSYEVLWWRIHPTNLQKAKWKKQRDFFTYHHTHKTLWDSFLQYHYCKIEMLGHHNAKHSRYVTRWCQWKYPRYDLNFGSIENWFAHSQRALDNDKTTALKEEQKAHINFNLN